MQFSFRTDPTIVLHGYSPDAPADILKRVSHGVQPSALKGDFILVATGADGETGKPLTIFVATVISAIPYFYYQAPTGCVHAPNVFDCCRAAGLDWKWDFEALAQVALFDHVLGNRSLHAQISRVPAASVVVSSGGKLQIETEPFWQETYQANNYDSRLVDAGNLLLELLSELPEQKSFSLSLSAGYDSRALLAGLSHLKRNVQTGCMGDSAATDPRIAAQLAQATGYLFSRVDLTAEDYPASSEKILKATSGEKVFLHWHTGIYAQKVPFDPATIHLAGSNGEFSRSSLFDKGFIASILDTLRVSAWDKWIERQHGVNGWIAPEITTSLHHASRFAQQLNPERIVQSICTPGTYRFGDGLDIFYATQRVRNFIGLGIALYRSQFTTTSPFLDARFVRYAAHLRRADKLANRFPRTVIAQLQPKLLDYPTDESGVPMKSKPSLLYFRAKGSIKPYQRTKEAQSLPIVSAWAKAGYHELGGDLTTLSTNELLARRVGQWNFAITVGATLELIKKLGIAK